MGADRALDAAAHGNWPPPQDAVARCFDAILDMATSGCQWRMLPNDFPPVSTVRCYFYAWRRNGLLDEINRKLVEAGRLAEGRNAEPAAGIIERRAGWRHWFDPTGARIKTTESGGFSGYGEGRARHRFERRPERQADQRAQAPYRH